MAFLQKLFRGGESARFVRSSRPLVSAINNLESQFEVLTDAELAAKTSEFKSALATGAELDSLLVPAFAAVRESARRTLGQRHYDVQLLGGIALHRGGVAEMRTGEGKTLVCTLPAYLNALTGRGVHVVTVNDYLARRDAVWMGQIYAALGLSVGVINNDASYLYDLGHREVDAARDETGSFKVFYDFLKPCTRAEAYRADITYGTNNQYGFDYLRDNLAHSPAGVVQLSATHPGHHFAIIDEVDSILIDEARTPLIIAGPVGESESLYTKFADLVRNFTPGVDYTVEEKERSIGMTEEGITKAEKFLGIDNLYTDGGIKYVHHLETAVKAKALYEIDRHYVVRDGEVVIVDDFTGRLMPGRRWSDGLHQAIEAKEGVSIRQESRTFASITFQNYFRLYGKIAGMTGTASSSAEEFLKVYALDVLSIPTHRPSAREDREDLIFQTEKGKFQAIARAIKSLHEKGQPVLVGTVSIEKNELLSAYLKREGIPHQILNAKNHEQEGAIIAEAGKRGSVVIATNMAGRGVDIKLGGSDASEQEAAAIKGLGGLFVLGTERHEARRIDDQLRGRSGRQGDPGATQFYISFEDDLARIFASDRVKSMMGRLGIPEDEPIQNRLVSRAIENAQAKIEGLNFDRRKHVLDYDMVMNHQRTIIYERRNDLLFGGESDILAFLERALEETVGADELVAIREQIERKRQELGSEDFVMAVRQLALQTIDMHWVNHLETMDYLQSAVRLRQIGQRDPLVEYRKEGLAAFKEMERIIFASVIKLLPTLTLTKAPSVTVAATETSGQTIGRNDPCPCGSGKKYKNCGLINAPGHRAG